MMGGTRQWFIKPKIEIEIVDRLLDNWQFVIVTEKIWLMTQ